MKTLFLDYLMIILGFVAGVGLSSTILNDDNTILTVTKHNNTYTITTLDTVYTGLNDVECDSVLFNDLQIGITQYN